MKLFKINIEYIILFLCLMLLSVLAYLSTGYYEGADNISHLNTARYSFLHLELFLDHWGKPLFTLLSSPFAQFGFKGVVFFNILCGLLASYFAFRIAKELKYPNPWLALFFVTFAPYFFMMHLTTLTEMLFAAVLVISIFFAVKKRFLATAILLSFLPLVRNEGIIIFPFFFLFFIINKKYWQWLFMLTGFLIYSVIGYFYNGDFLWLINQMPYSVSSAYGNGSYWHFMINMGKIFGKPMLVLLLCGFLVLIYHSINKNKRNVFSKELQAEWLLIVLPLLAYIAFHSFLWGKGIGGSAGLLRVIVAVSPLASLMAVKGLNFFLSFFENKKTLKIILIIWVLGVLCYMPFKLFQIPVKVDNAGQLIKDAAAWTEANKSGHAKIYYYDPMFEPEFGFDPYDKDTTILFNHLWCPPYESIKVSSLIIWDAHFGAGEGKTSKQSLMENKCFKLIKSFQPVEGFVINDHPYEICIFEKIYNPLDTLR